MKLLRAALALLCSESFADAGIAVPQQAAVFPVPQAPPQPQILPHEALAWTEEMAAVVAAAAATADVIIVAASLGFAGDLTPSTFGVGDERRKGGVERGRERERERERKRGCFFESQIAAS